MISRLSAIAATFAIFATASFAAASSHHTGLSTPAATKQVRIVQLERVVVTGKRLSPAVH